MLWMALNRLLRFLSTLSLRRATGGSVAGNWRLAIFLSTLSLRRATISVEREARESIDFYPRSPCGERLAVSAALQLIPLISIHALLAESDIVIFLKRDTPSQFLSTLSLRRATTRERASIKPILDFYPRSPCGERRKPNKLAGLKLVFLSTLSLRRATRGWTLNINGPIFLSTLSLRRAT